MPPTPPDQCSPITADLPKRKNSASTSVPTSTVHHGHGDRGGGDDEDGDGDDDAVAGRLPVFVRYQHLEAAGIASSWQALSRLIDNDGFPEGIMLGRNTRAWQLDEVEAWIANRPTARKIVPPKKPRQDDIEGLN
jgi:predicted DNA-binding transcriptional regulator AlpA